MRALEPQLVDDVFDRAAGRAEADDDVLRVVDTIALERAVAPPRDALEFVCDRLEGVECRVHRRELLMAQLEVVVGHREEPLRRRVRDVEHRSLDAVRVHEPATTSSASRETGSAEWVIVKPSWQTSTGSMTSGCSASRGAMTIRSYASWAFSAKSWITPESRMSIESEWSQWMLIGPESARFPTAMTIGARIEAAMYTTSAISARPCDDVAVIVRAPGERRADRGAHRRVLGLDVHELAVSAPPCATKDAKPWMIGVCGVIGYTGTTSGSICRIASATAWPPVMI